MMNQQEKQELFTKFQDLHLLDDDICKSGKDLVWKIITSSKGLNKHQSNGIKNISFVGSLAEGCTIPRLFGVNDKFPDKRNREGELDLDYTWLEIPEDFKHLVQEDPTKRGFVKVQGGSAEFISLARNIGWSVSEEDIEEYLKEISNEQGYIKPYKLKSVARGKLELQNVDRFVELIIAAAMEEKPGSISITHDPNTIGKAAIGAEFVINVKHRPVVQVSIDYATICRTSWWPDQYAEWKHRVGRLWPTQDVIKDLSKGCNLIAKPSDDEEMNQDTVEFKYSFAHIERSLAGMRSRQQMLVYLIFKIFLVKYLKPEDPNGKISSFLAKNTMLWACEMYPPDHSMWNADFDSMSQALIHLLLNLGHYFQSGNLPYYFDRQVNLISSISKETQLKVSQKIKEIISDLESYLRFNMEVEMAAGQEILHITNSTLEVYDELSRKDYTRLLKQPELLQETLSLILKGYDLSSKVKSIEKEASRSGKKIEKEAQRLSDRVEKEASRSGKKVEKEAQRFFKRFGK